MAAGGAWRVLTLLALVSFLSIGFVDAQGSPCKQVGGPDCDSHATCYISDRGNFCACNGLYRGTGYSCKLSTWRVVENVLGSLIAFILIFYLCLACLGYNRRKQAQLPSFPMEPMAHQVHGYPAAAAGQSSATPPAMFAYPPQTGYPVTGFPPQVVNPASSKV